MGVIDPNNNVLTTATARNKKVAEQEASRLALELLESDIPANITKKVAHMSSPKPSPVLGPSTPPFAPLSDSPLSNAPLSDTPLSNSPLSNMPLSNPPLSNPPVMPSSEGKKFIQRYPSFKK
jgi:hypothetical protein